MKFELKPHHINIPDDELLEDLKNVAKKMEKDSIKTREYEQVGKFSSVTISTRFGTWNKALVKAGLLIKFNTNITEEELLENLEEVWIKLGRQPGRRDMIKTISKFSEGPYINKFGSWRKALEHFVKAVNKENVLFNNNFENKVDKINKIRKNRDINWRLRFLVMRRDNFKCQNCGRSPATEANIILHIDHKTAWSKGGETVYENLQTLCQQCNIGKSNLEGKEE